VSIESRQNGSMDAGSARVVETYDLQHATGFI
jgi:hypothetical protein